MGNTDSKSISQEVKKSREELTKHQLQQCKDEIEKMQTQYMNDRSIMSTKDLMAFIQVTETSKKQLERGGMPLTKPDLIAIVLNLKPQMKTSDHLSQLNQMRASDLISLIRCIVYDPQVKQEVHLQIE